MESRTTLGTLPIPEKEGYWFLGWFTDPVGGHQIGSFTPVIRNATYYAHWTDEVETTDVTFVDNVPMTLTYDDNLTVNITFEDNIW